MARLATCAFVLAVATLASSARAQQDAAQQALTNPSNPTLARALGCRPRSVLEDGDQLVVACRDRVFRIDIATQRELWMARSRSPIERLVRTRDGEILVTTARRARARLGAPAPSVEPRTPAIGVGEVTRSERNEVEVRLSMEGLASAEGDALAFRVVEPEGERRVATGSVERVEDGTAFVRVGIGERVPVGAQALPVDAVDHPLVLPPRIPGLLMLRGSVDGLIPIDGGGGALMTLEAAWHLDAPILLRGGLAPLGLGGRDDDGILVALGYVSAGLDLDWMALSLGLAATTFNRRLSGQTTVAVAPMLGARIGAAEGLSLDTQFFFTFDDVGVDLGVGRLRLSIPLAPVIRLVSRADIGWHGALRVDGGVTFFVEGRGERGSVELGLFAGIGHMFYQQVCPFGGCPIMSVLSPTAAIEVNWRP